MSEEKFHKEDERFDDMFRSSLGEMRTEPSAGVWNKLSRQMLGSELMRFHFTNIPNAFWAISAATVIIAGIGLYIGLGAGEPSTTPVPQQESVYAEMEDANEVTRENDANEVTSENDVNDMTVVKEGPAPAEITTITTITTPTTPTTPTIPTTQTTPATPTMETNATDMVNHVNSMNDVPVVQEDPAPAEIITALTTLTDCTTVTTITFPNTLPSIVNPVPQETTIEPIRKPMARSLDIGINVTPDMVFYNSSSGSFKYNYTFDLGARYNLGRFYIQSGAGLTYSTDIGDYAISYIKNDSVGYYYTINSFSIEPGNPEDPDFETKQVTVYDSVEYLYDYSTKNKYYYLQIPISFGYRIINKSSWRLSAEAGLLYAYLVSIQEPAPTFYIPEGRILDIERRTPQRNKHSLGITAAISVEYQFARNFFLLIEPTFKYYLQAIEENSSRGDKQPYSIGLRAGIWYRLNFKNKTR